MSLGRRCQETSKELPMPTHTSLTNHWVQGGLQENKLLPHVLWIRLQNQEASVAEHVLSSPCGLRDYSHCNHTCNRHFNWDLGEYCITGCRCKSSIPFPSWSWTKIVFKTQELEGLSLGRVAFHSEGSRRNCWEGGEKESWKTVIIHHPDQGWAWSDASHVPSRRVKVKVSKGWGSVLEGGDSFSPVKLSIIFTQYLVPKNNFTDFGNVCWMSSQWLRSPCKHLSRLSF